jgi:hypothetical protein
VVPDDGSQHSLDGAAGQVDRVPEPLLAQKLARVVEPLQRSLTVVLTVEHV